MVLDERDHILVIKGIGIWAWRVGGLVGIYEGSGSWVWMDGLWVWLL